MITKEDRERIRAQRIREGFASSLGPPEPMRLRLPSGCESHNHPVPDYCWGYLRVCPGCGKQVCYEDGCADGVDDAIPGICDTCYCAVERGNPGEVELYSIPVLTYGSARIRGSYVILDGGPDTTTWPRPDDPDGVQWRLRYAPDQLSEQDRMYAASVMAAYGSLCLHPCRTQKGSGQITGRLRRALDDHSKNDGPCPKCGHLTCVAPDAGKVFLLHDPGKSLDGYHVEVAPCDHPRRVDPIAETKEIVIAPGYGFRVVQRTMLFNM
jgi:hypothetical protein